MENCLLTKLKGTVENDSLQKYDTAFVDYLGGFETGNLRFYITTGTKPVTVKSKKQFYVGTTHTTPVLEYIIPANSSCLMEYEVSDIGTVPVSELIEIDGIYNIKKIGNSIETGSSHNYFDFTPTNKNGLSSLLNYAPLDCFQGYVYNHNWLTKRINLKYAIITYGYIAEDTNSYLTNIENVLNSELQTLCVFQVVLRTGNGYVGEILTPRENISNCLNLKVMKARYNGDISDLPINLELYHGVGSVTRGTIESYVSKCISGGRTSGRLILGVNLTNVTYNGTPMTLENLSGVTFNSDNVNWTVVSWTNGTMNPLSGTKPSDFNIYYPIRAIYTWAPYPTQDD